jgi:hypothetical protein
VVGVVSVSVVENAQPTNLANPAVSVVDQHISDLTYTAIVIVVNRNVFYLNNCPEIVILNVWIVVVTRVKGHINKSVAHCG